MNNNQINTFYVERTTELLNALHTKNKKSIKKICLPNTEYFYNNCHLGIQTSQLIQILTDLSCINLDTELIINDWKLQHINSDIKIISVYYEIHSTDYMNNRLSFYGQLVYNRSKIASVIIHELPYMYHIFPIAISRDELFFRDEREVLYIETMHNHVIWHCVSENIMERTSFRLIENNLSTNFVKIHRCYILNILHIKHVQNYEVQMTNGDILPIPRKRYLEIKEKLEYHIKNRS